MSDTTTEPTYPCPKGKDGDEIRGCGSTHTSQPDDEGLVDCFDCGIWFNPEKEAEAV
tara:strand:- start:500 stop:670 length:171 start_codon:yes stop_codon:yes gene_type:complete